MAQALPVSLLTDLSPSAFLLRKTSSVPNICIHLDFSPSSPSPCPSPSSPASLPTFNSDGKHYTPSFILPCDELVPKPSRNNSYCCVCKTPFEDYLTHLNTPAHLILMRKSDYHLRIEDLCKGFGVQGAGATCGKKEGTGRKRGRPAKTKNICKLPALVCKRSLSGKETSDESNRVEDHAV